MAAVKNAGNEAKTTLSELENDLTRFSVQIRRSIQDFTLCATFKEIDEQNSGVRGLMDNMRSTLEIVERLGRESLDKAEAEKARSVYSNYQQQLVSCQRQFRMANVSQIADLENKSSKDLLGQPDLRQRVRPSGGKESLISQHSNVTNNLKAISRQLAATVERSNLTVSNLEGSSKTLQEVDEEHRSLSGVIGQSKKLITKYIRREFTDKVLIMFALAFFFAVVLYILRKRVFPSFGVLEVVFYLIGSLTNGIANIPNMFN
ncbi:vesicle transport protein SEC20 [Eurytemora carolleeae]|uniref:vesicle transport protein SEC20 n=1 Tax=Eurytemora carolleeae TaxID=1294199 RepID=UPI000C75ED95|nr:vesicle transport protein SEC20 [Eurytemora carolleeae]|eukprot:XP_023332327.1 vesicle transport protein SEC20-like [Eurytemora affinis]